MCRHAKIPAMTRGGGGVVQRWAEGCRRRGVLDALWCCGGLSAVRAPAARSPDAMRWRIAPKRHKESIARDFASYLGIVVLRSIDTT